MKFIKTSSIDLPAEFLARRISEKLATDKKVLWLVPGGSAMAVAVKASQLIQGVDSNLSISLTDERPGEVGHAESNWQALKKAGLNYLTRQYHEVLTNQDTSHETAEFDAWLASILERTDFKAGLFGVGSDGHTAGILSGAPADPPHGLAAFYADGQKQRISVTPELIAKLDLAVVWAFGADKAQVIHELASGKSGLPMQALARAQEVFVYNDSIGEDT